jgi:hypothetical protein
MNHKYCVELSASSDLDSFRMKSHPSPLLTAGSHLLPGPMAKMEVATRGVFTETQGGEEMFGGARGGHMRGVPWKFRILYLIKMFLRSTKTVVKVGCGLGLWSFYSPFCTFHVHFHLTLAPAPIALILGDFPIDISSSIASHSSIRTW